MAGDDHILAPRNREKFSIITHSRILCRHANTTPTRQIGVGMTLTPSSASKPAIWDARPSSSLRYFIDDTPRHAINCRPCNGKRQVYSGDSSYPNRAAACKAAEKAKVDFADFDDTRIVSCDMGTRPMRADAR